MATYTICAKVLEKSDHSIQYDLLNQFCSRHNPHKVAVNDKIRSEYNSLFNNKEFIIQWLEWINRSKYFEKIECNEDPIFIKTCNKTYDKKLIVHSKNDYADYEWLIPVDKDEAINDMEPWTTTINQFGNRNQVTTWNNSWISRS